MSYIQDAISELYDIVRFLMKENERLQKEINAIKNGAVSEERRPAGLVEQSNASPVGVEGDRKSEDTSTAAAR